MATRFVDTLAAGALSIRPDPLKVAYLSTYPPRECGIATFCEDLINATHAGDLALRDPAVIAMESGARYHRYSRPVVHVVDDSREADYETAADFINDSPATVVSLQHEFGIYGGAEGSGLYRFLARIRKPVVTTLHTVLPNPSPPVREMTRALGERSERLMVMNPLANQILRSEYGIAPRKLAFLHHGAPAPLPERRRDVKERLGLAGRKVMCTFGLVGPGKGLEYAIAALPQVVKRHPDLLYLIVGQTHPGACTDGVDTYRESLTRMIQDLGVEHAVQFVNHYLTKDEIVSYLAASDLYITPYLNPHQICSGTLAYALAAGRAIISTPYLHARFLLARERGLLVNFADSEAITAAMLRVFDSPELQFALEARTRAYGQRLVWPEVGARYRGLLREAIGQRARVARAPAPALIKLPAPGLAPQTSPKSAWR
jgi:glycosyltransferase involved in cell wall biosynthesis